MHKPSQLLARTLPLVLGFWPPLSQAVAAVCNQPMFAAARSSIAQDSPWYVVTGDFNHDGKADTAIANFSSNTVSVLLGNGNGSLQKAVNYNVGVEPNSMAVADLNGDGKLDLIVATEGCAPCGAGQLPGGIWVLLGKGDGTFLNAVRASPGTVLLFAVGDFNGDGKPDVITASSSSQLQLLLGKGDGTFEAGTEVFTGNFAVSGAAVGVGDFNGDGKLDAITVDVSTGNLAMIPGNGNGTFGTGVTSGNQTLNNNAFLYLVVADFNGDHKPDVVTLNGTSNYVQVWLNKGDGSFEDPVNYPVGVNPTSVAIADFNRDGAPDLAVLGGTGPGPLISILLGKPNGTFQTAVNYSPSGNAMKSLAVADFNGDGKADLAIASQVVKEPTGVYTVLGNGDGTLQTAVDYPAGTNPQTAAIGDLNHDSIPDIAVASNGSNTVSVLIGKGDGTFKPAVNYPAGQGATGVAIGDFNGDGKPDLAVANVAVGSVSILLGNGDGTFKAKKDTTILFGAFNLAVGDFNKDGKQDLAVVSLLGVSVLLGNGDGTFQSPVTNGTRSGLGNVVAADFNGDGNVDLAVSNYGSNTISVLLGNGNGTFKTNADFTADNKSSVQTLAVADLNGDGKLDIAVADFGCNPCDQPEPQGNIAVLLGNGDGTFQKEVAYPADDPIQSIAVGDFNGDGHPDVAVTNFLTFRVTILLNNGNGTFQAPVGFGAHSATLFVAVADLNRDGRPDLVALNGGSNDVSILLNTCSCSGSSCLDITGVVNGASFAPGISSGQWVTIEGNNFFSGSAIAAGFVNGAYPTSSHGISVTIGGQPAFLEFLSPTQLNVIAPSLPGSGSVEVVVTSNGVPSEAFKAELQPFAPGFFLWPGGYAVATDINFKFKIKAGTFPGVATTPTSPGDVLVLWGTGFGPANPAVEAGHQVPASPTSNVSNSVQVKIGDQEAKVFGAALAPGFAGLVQVAVETPSLSDGDYPVVVTEGGISSPATTLITITK